MNSGSALFQTLTEEQLHRCARQYLGERLLGWELLKGGLFNTTYRLDLTDKSVILRLGPVNRHLLLPYEQGLMACEPAVQQLLLSRGIPTSRTLVLDLDRGLLDRDVAIVEKIPGTNMVTVEVSAEAEYSICRRAGEYTRVIHSITAADLPAVPSRPFGRASAVLSGNGSATWKEAMLTELYQWREAAIREKTLSDEDIGRACRLFEGMSDAFDAVTVPTLVHGDLWYGNILLDESGDIAAIIDGDRAFFGDPEFDLMLPWMAKKPFMEGYGRPCGATSDAENRQMLYRFLLRLEDCYILQSEYCNPDGYLQAKETVLEDICALEKRI